MHRFRFVASVALILLAAPLLLAAIPAAAQDSQQLRAWCYDDKATADQVIQGCDAVIASGRESQQNLALAYSNRGSAWHRKRDFDRAMRDQDQAIKLDPNDAWNWHGRAVAYGQQGQYVRAIQDLDQAIRVDPKLFRPWVDRCWNRAFVNQLQAALADCNEALRLQPNDRNALYGRGVARRKKGDAAGGNADMEAAMKINPRLQQEFVQFGIKVD